MDPDLLSYLEQMEAKLREHTDEIGAKLGEHIEQVVTRLRNEIHQAEARTTEHTEQVESRLRNEIHQAEARGREHTEHIETKLLTAFHSWASPNEARQRTHSRAVRSLDIIVESLEDRVKKIESGRYVPVTQTLIGAPHASHKSLSLL